MYYMCLSFNKRAKIILYQTTVSKNNQKIFEFCNYCSIVVNVWNFSSSGCTFRINGDFGQPQPVYIHKGTFLQPNGNSGQVHLDRDEQVTIACTGPRGRISQHTTEEDIAIGVSVDR